MTPLAIVLVKTLALGATPPFTVDLVGWRTNANVTSEQRKIASAYIEGMNVLNGLPRNNDVAQISCSELAQDLVTTHHFFHCKIAYVANAADGGPFDDGQVLAWDGKQALMHRLAHRHEPPQVPLPGEALDPRKLETVSKLEFRSAALWNQLDVKDEPATKLEAALNAALARRYAAFKPASALATLPGWLQFALAVHFDVRSLEWQPGLPPEAEVKEEYRSARGYRAAALLAAEKEAGAFGGTVRFRHDGNWRVFLQFDAPSRGLGFRERIIAYLATVYP